MTLPDDKLEQQVQTGLQTLIERYQFLDQLTLTMLQQQDAGQSIEREMAILEKTRQELAELEMISGQERQQYRESRQHASAVVKQLSADAANLLTRVIERIELLEQKTRQAQQKLVPTLNQNVRAHQMQQAYRSS